MARKYYQGVGPKLVIRLFILVQIWDFLRLKEKLSFLYYSPN